MNKTSAENGDRSSAGSSTVQSGEQMPNVLLNIPNLLCLLRIVAAPILVLLAWYGLSSWCLGLIVLLLFSDWLDGKLARRLKQQTVMGARLDSVADALFYASVIPAVGILKWDVIQHELIWIGGALASYLINLGAGWAKFRRLPSYHTRLAKTSWLLIAIALVSIMVDWSVWPLRVALIAITITNLEELTITLYLKDWMVDVPSFYHAVQRAKSEQK